MLPSALVLDVILMLSNSVTVTSIFGGMAFALLFYPSNWPIFGMFHVPVEYGAAQLTIADLVRLPIHPRRHARVSAAHRERHAADLRPIRDAAVGILLRVAVHPDVPPLVVSSAKRLRRPGS